MDPVTGGAMGQNLQPVSKGRRFAAAAIDLIFIPIVVGMLLGILLIALPDLVRTVVLVAVNICWLIFRDTVFSPGRNFMWRRICSIVWLFGCVAVVLLIITGNAQAVAVIPILMAAVPTLILIFDRPGPGANLKLVSLVGEKVSLTQAFVRNVFLVIPFVLIAGYWCEFMRVLSRNVLLGRRLGYVFALLVVLLLGVPSALASKNILTISAMIGVLVTPVIFLILDKADTSPGDRLMDSFSKTKVVSVN